MRYKRPMPRRRLGTRAQLSLPHRHRSSEDHSRCSRSEARSIARGDRNAEIAAPFKILRAVEEGLSNGIEAGFEAEARGFGELVVSREANSLIHVFFASTEAKSKANTDRDVKPKTVEKIGVLGAGLMGAGIAA